MDISAAQCRAARALLDWSQDQLATNAQVARATIADFERSVREPIRNNMVSIVSALEAAGLAFVDENGGGAGVRFRKIELEYNRDLKFDDGASTVILRVRYRGNPYRILIPRRVIEDMDRTSYRLPEQFREAVARHLPIHLRTAEEAIIAAENAEGETIVLSRESYPPGIF
jgi:transcriptional regulator with XRE-family HTH domain